MNEIENDNAYLISSRLGVPIRSRRSSRYTRQKGNHRVCLQSGLGTVCLNAPRVRLARMVYTCPSRKELVLSHEKMSGTVTDSDAHRMTILSSISSTPVRRSEAKTGGMDRTRLAFTMRNSLGGSDTRDLPLSLGDFSLRFCGDKPSCDGGAADSAVSLRRFSFFFFDELCVAPDSSVDRCFRFFE